MSQSPHAPRKQVRDAVERCLLAAQLVSSDRPSAIHARHAGHLSAAIAGLACHDKTR